MENEECRMQSGRTSVTLLAQDIGNTRPALWHELRPKTQSSKMKSDLLEFARTCSNVVGSLSKILYQGSFKGQWANSVSKRCPTRRGAGAPPCTAVPPSQGRCLLRILHILPVPNAVPRGPLTRPRKVEKGQWTAWSLRNDSFWSRAELGRTI
jgi:hypothetical protein